MVAPVIRKTEGIRRLTIRVALVTRQFGGGATPREPDLSNWLRSASVRGALRFWWRATARHRSVAEMWQNEAAIFGAAAVEVNGQKKGGPGKLAVVVRCQPVNASEQSSKVFDPLPGSPDPVAYFPAQPLGQTASKLLNPSNTRVIADIELRGHGLTDNQYSEVIEALRAWIVFGGSGARTRRGAGAVTCASLADATLLGVPLTNNELNIWLQKYFNAQRLEGNFFQIAGFESCWITELTDTAEDAHHILLRSWREVRQRRPHPDSWQGAKDWGITRWPEADALRIIFSTFARWSGMNGAPGVTHSPIEGHAGKSPRAHLGLPIGIKFKDTTPNSIHQIRGTLEQVDPRATSELIAKGATGDKVERYASPVLLAVHRTAYDPSKFLGIILVTPSTLSLPIKLKDRFDNPTTSLSAGAWTDVRTIVHEVLKKASHLQPLILKS